MYYVCTLKGIIMARALVLVTIVTSISNSKSTICLYGFPIDTEWERKSKEDLFLLTETTLVAKNISLQQTVIKGNCYFYKTLIISMLLYASELES